MFKILVLVLSILLNTTPEIALQSINSTGKYFPDKYTLTQFKQYTKESVSWINYPDKYFSLAGIKYPDGFSMISDTSGFEIFSAYAPVFRNNYCYFRGPCDNAGLQINVTKINNHSKTELKDTQFSAIKSKILLEKRGRSEKELAIAKKYHIPDNEVIEYLYSEYYFISKGKKSYLIQVYQNNFNGDSSIIIDGFLSSLHE